VDIAIAADHGGFELKSETAKLFKEQGITYHDFWPHDRRDVDYPDYAQMVARAVAAGQFRRGMLICGTGQGMAISANKIKGIRAAVCHDTISARMSREHNDANVLCLGQRVIGPGLAGDIVKTWLDTDCSDEERNRRRVKKIMALEESRDL
jgi:ribose 5-phosphate isomerase B